MRTNSLVKCNYLTSFIMVCVLVEVVFHLTSSYEYPALDVRFNEAFKNAVMNHTTIVINKILGFDNSKLTVDV